MSDGVAPEQPLAALKALDLDALEARAAQGEAAAKYELGARLLIAREASTPDDARRGAALIAEAAEADVVQAAETASVLAGAGIGRAQDWTAALSYLVRAAELGSAHAQSQLKVLAAGPQPDASPPTGDDWAAMQAGVDLNAWLTPPPKRALREGPLLRAVDGFASRLACDWLIERNAKRLARAQIYSADSGAGAVDEGRTNTECDLEIEHSDLIVLLFRERIAALTKFPTAAMELAKILHYSPGETFGEHFDFLEPANASFAEELNTRGQRIATFLVYLNDDYEGGETDFPTIGFAHRGRKGDAFYFANLHRSGAPDRDTLHAGRPPTSGEKWLFSQWIRDRAPAPAEG